MATITNLTTLKINYLTQAQYDTALANGQINNDELYFTPQQAMKKVTIQIPASGGNGWNGTTFTYTNADIKASDVLKWTPASTATLAMVEALAGAQFIDAGTTTGSASIKALDTAPTIACNVTIYWLGQTE